MHTFNKYIIIGNFGDNTIALMQWVFNHKLSPVHVISVDTHWSCASWDTRVNAAQKFSYDLGFQWNRLNAKVSFVDLVKDRETFPTVKHQWCAGLLKGINISDWLDENDPNCEAVILLPKRIEDNDLNVNLQEYIEDSEYYSYRTIWLPIYNLQEKERNNLIEQAGFEIIHHRSLECQPCIYSTGKDFINMDKASIARLSELEQDIDKNMFPQDNKNGILEIVEYYKSIHKNKLNNEVKYFGCGESWGCGI